MSVRIISGKFKGLKLEIPKSARPTLSRARQALFDSLYSFDSDFFTQKTVLDVFAGSGAFGIEALSRGSAFSYFFDADTSAFAVLERNLALLKSPDAFFLRKLDVKKIFQSRAPVDIIFLDPPYGKFSFDLLLELLYKKNWADRNTFFILEEDQHNFVDFQKARELKRIAAGRTVFFLCNILL